MAFAKTHKYKNESQAIYFYIPVLLFYVTYWCEEMKIYGLEKRGNDIHLMLVLLISQYSKPNNFHLKFLFLFISYFSTL